MGIKLAEGTTEKPRLVRRFSLLAPFSTQVFLQFGLYSCETCMSMPSDELLKAARAYTVA